MRLECGDATRQLAAVVFGGPECPQLLCARPSPRHLVQQALLAPQVASNVAAGFAVTASSAPYLCKHFTGTTSRQPPNLTEIPWIMRSATSWGLMRQAFIGRALMGLWALMGRALLGRAFVGPREHLWYHFPFLWAWQNEN